MLEQITWTEYAGGIGMALVAYYLYVWWRYGKQKGNRRFADDDIFDDDDSSEPILAFAGTGENDAPQQDGPTDADFEQAEQLVDSIKSVIQIATIKKAGKEELTGELRSLLACYPMLKIPAFRPGINYQIITELNDIGSVTLSEREVDGLW